MELLLKTPDIQLTNAFPEGIKLTNPEKINIPSVELLVETEEGEKQIEVNVWFNGHAKELKLNWDEFHYPYWRFGALNPNDPNDPDIIIVCENRNGTSIKGKIATILLGNDSTVITDYPLYPNEIEVKPLPLFKATVTIETTGANSANFELVPAKIIEHVGCGSFFKADNTDIRMKIDNIRDTASVSITNWNWKEDSPILTSPGDINALQREYNGYLADNGIIHASKQDGDVLHLWTLRDPRATREPRHKLISTWGSLKAR